MKLKLKFLKVQKNLPLSEIGDKYKKINNTSKYKNEKFNKLWISGVLFEIWVPVSEIKK